MDEKWNIFFENDELNFYRSWTGDGIFKVKFNESPTGELKTLNSYVVRNMLEKSTSEYWGDLINWIIERLMFNREIDIPKP